MELCGNGAAKTISEEVDEEGFEQIFLEVYLDILVMRVGREPTMSGVYEAFRMNLGIMFEEFSDNYVEDEPLIFWCQAWQEP